MARITQFPQHATLRCTGCGKVGTTGQVTGHTATSKTCRGRAVEVVAYPPGTEAIYAPVAQAAAAPRPEEVTPSAESANDETQPSSGVGAVTGGGWSETVGADEPDEPDDPDGDEDEDEDEDGDEVGDGDEVPEPEPVVVAKRPRGRPRIHPLPEPGVPVAARAAPAAREPVLSEPWRPVQLSPESHVYYRIACTSPLFAEKMGGNFSGSISDFIDQWLEAGFAQLGFTLGLAELAPAQPSHNGNGNGRNGNGHDEKVITLTPAAFRDLLQTLGVKLEAGDGRTTALAGR